MKAYHNQTTARKLADFVERVNNDPKLLQELFKECNRENPISKNPDQPFEEWFNEKVKSATDKPTGLFDQIAAITKPKKEPLKVYTFLEKGPVGRELKIYARTYQEAQTELIRQVNEISRFMSCFDFSHTNTVDADPILNQFRP